MQNWKAELRKQLSKLKKQDVDITEEHIQNITENPDENQQKTAQKELLEGLLSGRVVKHDVPEEQRRTKPTFHIQLKKEIERVYKNLEFSHKEDNIEMYGRDMSILGGTHGYLLGLNVIKNSIFPNHLKLLAINEYTEAMDFLIKGHIIEEYMNYHNITMTLEQYLNIVLKS